MPWTTDTSREALSRGLPEVMPRPEFQRRGLADLILAADACFSGTTCVSHGGIFLVATQLKGSTERKLTKYLPKMSEKYAVYLRKQAYLWHGLDGN